VIPAWHITGYRGLGVGWLSTAGKGAVTVRQLLSHQAGLPAVCRRLPPGSMLDWPAMTAALAAQEPW
jgi:CubicO group peptidase (beta-lactamase class C family)